MIDDLGNDRAQADALFRLSYPLTLSVLPHLPDSTEIAEEAHRRGYQVMLHLPMASNAGDKDEPVELHPGMDANSGGKDVRVHAGHRAVCRRRKQSRRLARHVRSAR